MGAVVENIVAQALRMPPKDRAIIAERLISSLDPEVDWDVKVAWQQEVQRRIDEMDKGEVVCLPWEQVLQRLGENGRATA